MARPDSTPPDDSLFPIAPCYTAELDAKALDEIVEAFKRGRPGQRDETQFQRGRLLDDIEEAVRKTGRVI